MIIGVGTDIVEVRRMVDYLERHGERGVTRVLAASEMAAFRASVAPAKFLAKRFATKEAVGKAFGTGLRAPLLMPNIAVVHDDFGKPAIELTGEAEGLLQKEGRALTIHLSISDEELFAVSFVVVESQ